MYIIPNVLVEVGSQRTKANSKAMSFRGGPLDPPMSLVFIYTWEKAKVKLKYFFLHRFFFRFGMKMSPNGRMLLFFRLCSTPNQAEVACDISSLHSMEIISDLLVSNVVSVFSFARCDSTFLLQYVHCNALSG